MATVEYSIVRVGGEWRLQVGHEVRGAFASEEAAIAAASNAANAAQKMGYQPKFVANSTKSIKLEN